MESEVANFAWENERWTKTVKVKDIEIEWESAKTLQEKRSGKSSRRTQAKSMR